MTEHTIISNVIPTEVEIDGLKPQWKAILAMVYSEARPQYHEVAATLGIPVGTVKSRIHRAKAFIHKHREANGHVGQN